MAFTPHWIDTFSNGVGSDFGSGRLASNVVRIGNDLYGVFVQYDYSSPGFPNTPTSTRKSTDAGLTWTDLGVGPTITQPYGGELRVVAFERSGKMEIFWAQNSVTNVQWDIYDPIGNSWAGPYNTGLPFWRRQSFGAFSHLAAIPRPDGSTIVAFPDLTTFDVRISKHASGDPNTTWSTLGGFYDSPDFAILVQSGCADDAGNVHLMFARDVDDSGTNKRKIVHVSVDASTDTISSEHDVELDIDIDSQSNYAYAHIGPIYSKGTQLLFSYGYLVATNELYSSTYGTLHVAFGDLSGDALNPSWTLSTVIADQQSVDASFHFVQSQPVIISGTPWVYYTTAYPAADPLDAGTVRLWRSYWTGSAWNTPAVWYDPATDGTLSTAPITLPAVSNFYLLKAFGDTGVGIMLNVIGSPVSSPSDPSTFAAYDGPSMVVSGRRTFASQPMHMQRLTGHSRTSRVP